MDEDALLRELQMQISKSPHKKLIKHDDEFDISQSMSPNGKFDKQLEKIVNEQQQKGQEEDLDFLMMNIEKENKRAQNSPEMIGLKNLARNRNVNQSDFLNDDHSHAG